MDILIRLCTPPPIYPNTSTASRPGIESSSSARFTDAAMSFLESMSVPSRSNIRSSNKLFPLFITGTPLLK